MLSFIRERYFRIKKKNFPSRGIAYRNTLEFGNSHDPVSSTFPSPSFQKAGDRSGPPGAATSQPWIAQRAPRRRLCHVSRRRTRTAHLWVSPTEKLMSLRRQGCFWNLEAVKSRARARERTPGATALLSPLTRITSPRIPARSRLIARETHSRKRRHTRNRENYRRQSNAAPDISLRVAPW